MTKKTPTAQNVKKKPDLFFTALIVTFIASMLVFGVVIVIGLVL